MKKFVMMGVLAGVLSVFGAESGAKIPDGMAGTTAGVPAVSAAPTKAEGACVGKRARRKLTDEEKEACRARLAAARVAREKVAAEKAGLTLEAYRDRRDAAQAKRLGMTVEELRRLTPAERRARGKAAKKAQV